MYSEPRAKTTRPIEEYRTAISLAPDEPLPLRQSRRRLHLSQNKPDEARQLLDDAIARGVDSSRLPN